MGGDISGLPDLAEERNTPEEIYDAGLVQFGSAPSLGMDNAMALSRVRSGIGGVGDLNMLQQQGNPSVAPEANAAKARQQWRAMQRNRLGGRGGLVGAARQAIYG
jgi:hypothetical protein